MARKKTAPAQVARVEHDIPETQSILPSTTGTTLDGTRHGDRLKGGRQDDIINGKGGDDVLLGGAGDDRLDGGKGSDRLLGGAGHDVLIGGVGNDTLNGGSGDDQLHGGTGNDKLHGGAGDDVLLGGTGDDYLNGGAGNDTYQFGPGAGHDVIVNNASRGQDRDQVILDDGITAEQVWLERSGSNLRLTLLDSGDTLTVRGWYSSPARQVANIALAAGERLAASKVDSLVQAMSAFDLPAAAGGSLSQEIVSALTPVLAASWQ